MTRSQNHADNTVKYSNKGILSFFLGFFGKELIVYHGFPDYFIYHFSAEFPDDEEADKYGQYFNTVR